MRRREALALLAALALGCSMSHGTISPTANVVFTGDSITAGTPGIWYTNAVAAINAAFAPQVLSTVNTGVGSTGIAAIASDVPGRITSHNPTHVVVEIGINDITVLGTSLPTYLADMATIVNACTAAGVPASNIWWLEIGLYGEAWHTVGGVPQWNNAFDSTIDTWNAAIASECATLGITFVHLRAALLASAVVNNPTGLINNGILTLSTGGPNPHPSVALGQPIWSSQWLADVTVSTTTTVNTHPISLINYNGKAIWIVSDAIGLGTADGVSEVGGCGWRNLLALTFTASGITPTFVGTLTAGYLCSTCPENGAAPRHDAHSDFDCPTLQAGLAGWFASIGSTFDVMILEAGTKDLQNDLAHSTSLAQGNFDSLLAACVALKPTARFFVSNLPPSPQLNTAPLGQAFASHVASKVAAYAAGGTKMVLVDHFNGIPPQGSSLTLLQSVATTGSSGGDFTSTSIAIPAVYPSGPGGASAPQLTGFPKMAEIIYLTMTHAAA